MFSLGEKQRVLNTSADVKVFDGMTPPNELTTVTAITTAGFGTAAANVAYFTVSGFGKFKLSKLTEFKGIRAAPSAAEVADFAVVVPVGLALGDVIETRITYKTARYQAALSNNYIGGGHPVIIQTQPLGALTAGAIASAVGAAWTSYLALYAKFSPFFNVTASGNNIHTVVSSGFESVTITKVEISIARQGAGNFVKTSLAKTTSTIGNGGRGLGKYLEESVRVSTAENVRAYGLTDAADTQVDLRGSYTQFIWGYQADYGEVLGNDSSDDMPKANHRFSLWLNESTCIDAANGTSSTKAINKLSALVVGVGLPAAATVATTTDNFNTVALLNPADAGVATTILFTT